MTKQFSERSFTVADQEAFAGLTGDRNPMHMDDAIARRTQASACVVHGIHVTLWMLEQCMRAGVGHKSIARINVRFAKFVLVGQSVSVWIIASDDKSAKIEARVDDLVVIAMKLSFGSSTGDASAPMTSQVPLMAMPSRPLEPAFDALDSISGRLALETETDALRLFPTLCETFGAAWVGSVGLLSTVVGMVVPGLHSIFSSLSLTMTDDRAQAATVTFRVAQADDRFRLVTMSVAGAGFAGEITAFMRFPPIEAPKMDRVATMVASDAFKDRTALVIGGSRGIGANIAKLIAAGGGKVVVTYLDNRAAADSIALDINTHCKQVVCWSARYDVLTPDDITNLGELERFTHVYYCATAKIGRQRASVYFQQDFNEFCEVYVDGFHALASALLKDRPANRLLTILYPSSIYVTERPRHMTEYAMAKAAGEILCADLATAHRNLRISMPRLPRVLTDQTATVPPVETADALEVMLPLLLAE